MIRNTAIHGATAAGLMFAMAMPVTAAPLPNETLLTIIPGTTGSTSCLSGSCFSMEITPGFVYYTPLKPGTDGGFILGKNQLGGGQEKGQDSLGNSATGQITAAWDFFSNYGTFATAPLTGDRGGTALTNATLNVFDAASCLGVECIGRTVLGTLNVAWGGLAVPMGSAAGCNSVNCTAEQRSGIFVDRWIVNADGTYILDYSSVVPDGHSSDFGGTRFTLHLEGRIQTGVNTAPSAGNVSVTVLENGSATWKPVVNDVNADPLSCAIVTPPTQGSATVATDCSGGTYVPVTGYNGPDSFTYKANDGRLDSGVATVSVAVAPLAQSCKIQYPIISVFTVGGGQSPPINESMGATFTGHIGPNNSKNSGYVCANTDLEYAVTTTVGTPNCTVGGSPVPNSGIIRLGTDSLLMICTNKPVGGDTDRFSIKALP